MTLRPRVRELALSAWLLATISYAWTYSELSGPNEYTRAYLTAALVDDHAIRIDRSLRRFGGVYDLASHDGHFYSDKAPGSSLLAAPIYALARAGDDPKNWDADRIVNLARTWLMLPLSLLGFVLLRRLLRLLGRSEAAIDLVSVGYSLGSAVLHYGTALYGHVIVATLWIAVLYGLAEAGVLVPPDASIVPPRGVKAKCAWVAFAGMCAGLAGLTEYQATAAAALFLWPVLRSGPGRWWAALAYTAGGLPCALVLLAYNKAAFGGPFQLSYQHLVGTALRDLHGNGLAGATWPTREALLGLLFRPSRGLLATSPWFACGFVGLVWMAGRRSLRALWLTLLSGCVYFYLAVASSSVWFGGWAFGPRLLIPAMPLFALAAAYAFDAYAHLLAFDVIMRAAVAFSVVYQQLVQVTFPELPPETQLPLQESVGPLLLAGIVTPNLGCKFMPLGLKNMIPLAVSLVGWLGFIAWPRAGSARARALGALGSLTLAAALLWAVWRIEPPSTPEQRAGWTHWGSTLMQKETRCRAPH